jgi:23S rRNA (cytidine2498-2'-O)-methyltransferase
LAAASQADKAKESEKEIRSPSTRLGARAFWELLQDPANFGADAVRQQLIDLVVESLAQAAPAVTWDGLHVWIRDGLAPASHSGRQPQASPPAGWQHFVAKLQQSLQSHQRLPQARLANANALPGQRILDVCLTEPDQLLLGEHVVQAAAQRWPGGVIPLVPTATPPISRAYFKVREAVSWAGLDLRPGQLCVEMGSSPGGSCQWLLEQDLRVIGIDPAEIDPQVAQHPRFMHLRCRGREVKRRAIAGCDWLLSDANLPPNYVLDTLADLLQHPQVRPRGLIITLKLPNTQLLDHWDKWQQRVASWGFGQIRGRQLIFNRQEVCLVATR